MAAAVAGACAVALCCALMMPVGASAATVTEGISGTVTNRLESSEAIAGVTVCAYETGSETQVECASEPTNSHGEYEIEVPEGEYKVRFSKSGFATQWYANAESWLLGGIVAVESSEVTGGIGASLVEEGVGSVSGTVTDASTGQPIAGIEACPYYYSYYGGAEGCAETASNGTYTLGGIGVGNATVYFSPKELCEEEELKINCEPASNYLRKASAPVRVRVNQTTSLNATMQAGGEISGTVTNAGIAHPALAKVEVEACAVSSSGKPLSETESEAFEYDTCARAFTNASGQYAILGLRGGTYKVEFNGTICTVTMSKAEREAAERAHETFDSVTCPEVYIRQYYSGQPTFQKAGTVAVTLGADTANVNESLREAFPTAPAATAAPAVTGTPTVGSALSCSAGGWAHEPLFLTYQWLRNGAAISGQTGTTYTVQAADEGTSLSCQVLVGNGAGMASATSNALAVGSPIAVAAHKAKVKGNNALVKVTCSGGATCTGSFKVVATEVVKRHHKRHKRQVNVGKATFSVATGKTATVKVRLSAKARKLLRKSGKLEARLTGTGIKAGNVLLNANRAKKKGKQHKKGHHKKGHHKKGKRH